MRNNNIKVHICSKIVVGGWHCFPLIKAINQSYLGSDNFVHRFSIPCIAAIKLFSIQQK